MPGARTPVSASGTAPSLPVTPERPLPEPPWCGQWVADRLGVRLHTTDSPSGLALTDLVGLAVRRNPKRAHLLVSTVLGKHMPTSPYRVHESGLTLGRLCAAALPGSGPVVVLGNAETATGLGHCVAEALDAPYLHSTRRPAPHVPRWGQFTEAHSHATEHLLLPAHPLRRALGDKASTIVLVDDELSTGATALDAITALHHTTPHRAYLLASLVDVRSAADRERAATVARDLGVWIGSVSLAEGRVELPPDALAVGQRLVTEWHRPDQPVAGDAPPARRVPVDWPSGVAEGARHGVGPDDTTALGTAAAKVAEEVAGVVTPGTAPVLVLGVEELMYAPLMLARALADALPQRDVRYSTTTRSPVLPVDDPGYAIRTRLSFHAHDNPATGSHQRYAYNVALCDAIGPWGTIVLVLDTPGDTAVLDGTGGLLPALRRCADEVLTVVLPTVVPEVRR